MATTDYTGTTQCDNCGTVIGRDQPSFERGTQTLCAACDGRARATPPPTQPPPSAKRPSSEPWYLDNLLLPKAIAIVAAIYLTASPQSRGIFGPDYTGAYIAWGVVAALMVVTWIRATPPENKDKH